MGRIGRRVRELREEFGFSLNELSAFSRISEGRLREIEAGEGQPTSTEFFFLAEGLGVAPSSLQAAEAPDAARSPARFRAAFTGDQPVSPSDRRLLARGAEVGRIVAFLRRELQLPSSAIVDNRRVQAVSSRLEPWEEGYRLGAEARLALAPDPAPLLSMRGWLEGQGVHVALVRFASEEIEAASVYEAGAAPVILLNEGAKRVRSPLPRRAILAHELCHLLHDGGEKDLTVVSREHEGSAEERRANAFAPSFLAPKEWVQVQPQMGSRELVVHLAETWGLSFEGAVWHAKNLKLIGHDAATDLVSTPGLVRAPGFESEQQDETHLDVEPSAEPSPLANGLLSSLAHAAAVRGIISRGRAQEILRIC